MGNTAKVRSGQTLLDVAIQEYGSAESWWALAQANNLEPTDYLVPGTTLLLPNLSDRDPALTDARAVRYFRENAQYLASEGGDTLQNLL
jgi:hypothetical protein